MGELKTERTPLEEGTVIALEKNHTFQMGGVLGEGGSCICYQAWKEGIFGRLKEYYPADSPSCYYDITRREDGRLKYGTPVTEEAIRRGIVRLKGCYERLNRIKTQGALANFLPYAEIYEGNGTVYIWTPQDRRGVTFEEYLKLPWKEDPDRRLLEILKIVVSLCEMLEELHQKARVLVLDVKPSNFLLLYRHDKEDVMTEPLYLFDVDSLTPVQELRESGKLSVSSSPGFAAPEQGSGTIPPKRDKIGVASDVYGVGATFYYALTGEIYSGDLNSLEESPLLRACDSFREKFFRDTLRKVLERALDPEPKKRYTSCGERGMAGELKELLARISHRELNSHLREGETFRLVEEEQDRKMTVYQLLYQYPLYEFGKDKNINLWILGSDEWAEEFLKNAVICGQMPGWKLNLAVISEKAREFEEKLKKKAPSMAKFLDIRDSLKETEEKKDAFATVYFLPWEGNSREMEKLEAMLPYDYAFVSSVNGGNKEVFKERILALSPKEGKRFLGIVKARGGFCGKLEENSGVTVENIRPLGDFRELSEELNRRAYNVHYIYTKSGDPNAGDLSIWKSFQDSYNRLSSTSNALHISYKLFAMGIDPKDGDRAAEEYLRRYRGNEKALDELAYMEHRRWMAYMVMDGYREPESYDYILSCGNEKDKKNKYHPCLVYSGLGGLMLKNLDRKLWDQGDIPAWLDELDRMSIRLHRFFAQVMDEQKGQGAKIRLQAENTLAMLKDLLEDYQNLKMLLQNLEHTVQEVFGGSERAAWEFDKRVEELRKAIGKQASSAVKKETGSLLDFLKSRLFPAIQRNKYIDYKKVDYFLVENLPFLLSYRREKELTVLFDDVNAENNLELLQKGDPGKIQYLGRFLSQEQLYGDIKVFANVRKRLKDRGVDGSVSLKLCWSKEDVGAGMAKELKEILKEAAKEQNIPVSCLSLKALKSEEEWNTINKLPKDFTAPVIL